MYEEPIKCEEPIVAVLKEFKFYGTHYLFKVMRLIKEIWII